MRPLVGLVGIGLVGTALAKRLLAAGFSVYGYDIDPARGAALVALGGIAARSLAEVGADCSRVVLALNDSETVERVVSGDGGLLSRHDRPALVVDCGTGDPERIAALASRLALQGVAFVEAPLSGSSAEIEAGTALCLVGGEDTAVQLADTLLDAIARRRTHVGSPRMAARAKLATNLVHALNRAALAEGIVFAESIGLDPRRFLALLRESAAYSHVVDSKGEKMVSGDFAPQARIAQIAKDLGLMLSRAAAGGQSLPLTEAHARLLAEAIAAGEGDLDTAAIVNQIRRRKTQDTPGGA
jgi:3-hydroxyisobutyrate dehydrogenase-like beta-hydroxyacid dehydrogenase